MGEGLNMAYTPEYGSTDNLEIAGDSFIDFMVGLGPYMIWIAIAFAAVFVAFKLKRWVNDHL
jgi:hypothetical protein